MNEQKLYDSGDTTKSLIDWAAFIMALFPDDQHVGTVSVTFNDRINMKDYGSVVEALLKVGSRKDKDGEWSMRQEKDWGTIKWVFVRERWLNHNWQQDYLEIK